MGSTTAGFAPAALALPLIDLPARVERPPGADPFQEPAEPRPPRGGSEEKLEYFRRVIRLKDETLARARSLYAAVDGEAKQLRDVAVALKAQVEAAAAKLQDYLELPAQVLQLKDMLEKDTVRAEQDEQRILDIEADAAIAQAECRSLRRSLAEAEQQLAELTMSSDSERTSRAEVADELVESKELLNETQRRLSELTGRVAELEGDLGATSEQYEAVAAENERLSAELAQAQETTAGAAGMRAELSFLQERLVQLEDQLSEQSGLDAERDRLRADLAAMKKKLVQAETAVEAAASLRTKVTRLEAQLRAATASR